MREPKTFGRWVLAAGVALALSGCETAKPTSWLQSSKVKPSGRCSDFSFPVYFKEWSADLTDAAVQVIADSAQRAKPCQVEAVKVTGLSDAKGDDPQQNLELSKRRADVVAKALADKGFPSPVFEVEAAGGDGAVTKNGNNKPLRRRTEVQVHFATQ